MARDPTPQEILAYQFQGLVQSEGAVVFRQSRERPPRFPEVRGVGRAYVERGIGGKVPVARSSARVTARRIAGCCQAYRS